MKTSFAEVDMNTNKIYLLIIFILLGVVAFLVVLLFMGDSGKYCVPLTKEKHHVPVNVLYKDSLKVSDSLRKE
ncbi:MAG: hypothetical protein V4549_09670 [Bacteroidota bacterium]